MSQKYSDEVCDLDHTGELPQSLLDSLPLNQGHPVRHRCAACAYREGVSKGAAERQKLVDQVKELEAQVATLRATHRDKV